MIENAVGRGLRDSEERRYLPEGLVEGCRLQRDIEKDEVITYDDVELPAGRLADQLRAEQYLHFRGESWLRDVVSKSDAPSLNTVSEVAT